MTKKFRNVLKVAALWVCGKKLFRIKVSDRAKSPAASYRVNLKDEEIKNLTYQQQTKLFSDNPVNVAKLFQHKVQVFLKEIVLDGPLGKTKYYALRAEFQVRGSPHVDEL